MYLTKEPLSGNEKAKFILIKEDASNLVGMKLFKTIMNTFCKEHANITILSYDDSKDLLLGIDKSKENLKPLDVFSCSIGWSDEELSTSMLSMDNVEKRYYNFKGVLLINSLTSLIIHNGINKVFKTLKNILNNNSELQIVSLVCPKVHDSFENEVIDKLATTILQVDFDEGESKLLSIVHYSSGKVNCLSLEYKISASFEFLSLVDTKFQFKKKKEIQQPDPTANLTFNLRLKDEEKEARSQLLLPYMKMQTSDEAIVQSLLDNDLYDEEDPDDDLDI